MLRQQMSATGMLRATMPADAGSHSPASAPTRSMSRAIPVNPLESRPAGLTNAEMA